LLVADASASTSADAADGVARAGAGVTAGASTSTVTGGGEARPAAAAPGIDRSRGARLSGGVEWRCPFPAEADDAGIDSALVSLALRITPQGSVETVNVLHDPGHGFGSEAKRCALRKRWDAGLDRTGRPVASDIRVNVRFVRE
jgi:protein TonB